MKAHKYWSIGTLVSMIMTMYTGHKMASKKAHKYWAIATIGCMLMAIYSGHKMIRRKAKMQEEKQA